MGCGSAAQPGGAAAGAVRDEGATSDPTGSADRGVTWPSGTDGLDPAFFTAFGSWRGLPSSSRWINAHWLKWTWLTAPGLASSIDGETRVRVWELLQDWLAFENNFNNGGLGEWHLYPPEADNEKSAARYKELW